MAVETQVKPGLREGVTSGERSELDSQTPARAGGGGWTAVSAITQRELSSTFYSPIAYVIGFIFLLLTGYFFLTNTLVPGNEASMRSLLEQMAGLLVFALPLLTMRTIADEFSTGAIETLMTAPVTDAAVVVGKFLGSFLFYLALLATTCLHLAVMSYYADPVAGVVFSGYLGMVLLGAFFIAVGIFASSCTRHQLLAASLAMGILAIFTFAVDYASQYAPAWRGIDWRSVFAYLNVMGHFDEFAKGTIDLSSVVFFLSGTALFLFLATKVMESRRWR
jgi:ABC-2 type transport system permease protein